jgi:phosphatidylglycerophosphate synthase
MKKYLIAEYLTLTRIVWAGVLVGMIIHQEALSLGWVLATSVVLATDAVDGSAARRWPYPKDGKDRWWRRESLNPATGAWFSDSRLDTPADMVLGLAIIAYTWAMVSQTWGWLLFTAVPVGIWGMWYIARVENRRSGVHATGLRSLRLSIYFFYIAVALILWLNVVSDFAAAWVFGYVGVALLLSWLKRGRLTYGKEFNANA